MIGFFEPLGYRALAAMLREQITSGQLRPGDRMPSEKYLEQTHGTSRATVRRAVAVLRDEGLIITAHGYGTYVREAPPTEVVRISDPCRINARMPTPAERSHHRIPDGVPVLVLTRPGTTGEDVLPADRITLALTLTTRTHE